MDGPPPFSLLPLSSFHFPFNFHTAIRDHHIERTDTSPRSEIETVHKELRYFKENHIMNPKPNSNLCVRIVFFDQRAMYVALAMRVLEHIPLRSSPFYFCTKGNTFRIGYI